MFWGWAHAWLRECVCVCVCVGGKKTCFPGESLIDLFFPHGGFLLGSGLKIYSDRHVGSKVQTRTLWSFSGDARPGGL